MGTARLGPLLRICCFELLIVAAYVAARGAVAAVSTQTWAQNHFELLPEAQIYIQNKDNLRRLGNVTANTAVIGAPQKWSQFSLPLVPVDAASLRLDIFPGEAHLHVICQVTRRASQAGLRTPGRLGVYTIVLTSQRNCMEETSLHVVWGQVGSVRKHGHVAGERIGATHSPAILSIRSLT